MSVSVELVHRRLRHPRFDHVDRKFATYDTLVSTLSISATMAARRDSSVDWLPTGSASDLGLA